MNSTQLETSQLTFQAEKWAEFYREARHLFPLHWKELAIFQDRYQHEVDYDRYLKMDELGMLDVLTARVAGKLVGYVVAFMQTHMHYKSAGKMAYTDMYFVLPEHRKGVGLRLFVEFEKRMKSLGVVQLMTSCKVEHDRTEFFEKLGWAHTDNTFAKYIGDPCR